LPVCKRLLDGHQLPRLQGVQILAFQMPAPHHHKSQHELRKEIRTKS
jgi:hypothetical protein